MVETWTFNVLYGPIFSDFKMKTTKTLGCLTLWMFLESWDSISCDGVRRSNTEEQATMLVDSTHSILLGMGMDPMMLNCQNKSMLAC